MKVYTKHGDQGKTGLLYGGRVSKDDPRTEAYGTVDEAVSLLGLARAFSQESRVKEVLLILQRQLFTVGAELATDNDKYELFLKHFAPITSAMVHDLENYIDEIDEQINLPRAFVIPGASQASAAADAARSVLRRAERRAVALHETNSITNIEILRYLNRAADLIFMLARFEDRALPDEILTGNTSN